jgi:hypothetical protein
MLNEFGCGRKVFQPRSRVISVLAVPLCYRSAPIEHAGSRTTYRPAVSYVGCIVQNPTASWAQISTPHSEEKSIFDSEVELC